MAVLSDFISIFRVPNRRCWHGETIQNCDQYDLAVIEFDDQGWYHNPSAQDELAQYLCGKRKTNLTIILFIHGWRHNAAKDDENLLHFHRLLEDAAENERYSSSKRHVLGVYIGWRGMSLRGLASFGTFWTRKNAAFRVAVGSVREVLASLRRHQRDSNAQLTEENVDFNDGTRLVLAGHSFGALILFSAVAEYLIDSVVRPKKKVVRPFGDLIILVNPAFEATRFQPLVTAIAARGGFAPGQRVCFMAVTARNDKATRLAFPISRWFGTFFEATRSRAYPGLPDRAQRDANLNTVGHLSWLTTHTLTAPKGQNDKVMGTFESGVGPSYPQEDKEFQAFNALWRPNGELLNGWQRTYASGAELKHIAGDPNNPFWVVEASKEVINGHNGIFRPIFLGFLRQIGDDRLRRKANNPPPATGDSTTP